MPQTRRPKLSAIKTILLAAQPLVGGQAVMEGVMMRSPNSFAVAVRRRNGNIVVREDAWRSLSERFTFLKWPLLRGATMLIESMYNGISALNFSAAQMMEDENPEEAEKIEKDNSGFALVLSLVMGFALPFCFSKVSLTDWLGDWACFWAPMENPPCPSTQWAFTWWTVPSSWVFLSATFFSSRRWKM